MKRKKQKKAGVLVPRLPKEAVELLRKKGGPQSTKKGKKGYDRKTEKQKEGQDIENNDLPF